MKKECKIVQDLLPNYLEKVTNTETNEFIEEHIKNCEECKKAYSSMQYDLNVEKIDTKEEVNYMKKFKKQLRILRNTLLVIIAIFVIMVARKAIILASLGNKLNKVYDPNNYKIMWNEERTGGEYKDLNNYHTKSI